MFTRLLGIRPEDRRDASVGFSMLLALMAGHAILETARDTLFLATLPARMLPWTYLIMAALTLGVAALNRKVLWRFSRRRALSFSLLGAAVVNLGFFALSSLAGSAGSLLAFYVWTGFLATVVVVQFWLLLAEVLDLSQAKRVFAWIAAGGLIGATLGSALAGLILLAFRAQALLVVASGLFALAAFLPALFNPARKPSRADPRAGDRESAASAWGLVVRDAYLARLLGFVLLGTLMVTGVDYVFKAVVAQSIPSAKLGDFFARYYAVLNACALLVQILIAPRVLQSAGVSRALLITPLLLLFAALGFGFSAGLIGVLVLKGTDGALRHSVNRTAIEILYLPLEPALRERFKALAEAVGQRAGQAVASLAILGALALGATNQQMAWALVVVSATWLACIAGLKPHYLELFRKQLRQGTIETRIDVASLDLHTLEALVSALSSEDDVEVIAAMEMFATYDKLKLIPALILFHPSRQVVLHAFELFAETKRKDVVRLTARLLRHPDHEIRAAALRHYSAREQSEETLRRCLLDESPACRATATVGLIAAGLMSEDQASEGLNGILDGPSDEARHALALSLRLLPAQRYAWVASKLASIKQPGLAALVARSVASNPVTDHVPALVLLLAQRDGRREAREALKKIGAPALDYLEKALGNAGLPRSVRRHLPRTISYFASPRAASILLARLPNERDDAVSYKILRGLGRMRADNSQIPVDAALLLTCAQSCLERAVRILAWRWVVDDGRARDMRYDTSASELLSALLHDFEASALERMFRLLHILEPSEEFAMIYDGLRSADPGARAASRELLENIVPAAMRDGILAMVDDAPPVERLLNARSFYDAYTKVHEIESPKPASEIAGRSGAEQALQAGYARVLAEMLEDASSIMRSVAEFHAAELGIYESVTHLRSRLAPATPNSIEPGSAAVDALEALSPLELSRA